MTRFVNHSLAVALAALLSLSSIGAIVTVPPAKTHNAFAVTELA